MTVLLHHLPNVYRLVDLDEIVINSPNYIEFKEDAVGWDGFKMIFERDEDHGFKTETSDGNITLDFDLITGYQLIKKIYNIRGPEARIAFQYLNKDTGTIYFDSELHFYSKPSFDTQFLKVALAKELFDQKFRTRQDTSVDLLSNVNLDGGAVTPLSLLSVNLPNKEILQNSTWVINPALTEVSFLRVVGFPVNDVVVPWQIQTQEIDGSQSPVAIAFGTDLGGGIVDSATHGIILTDNGSGIATRSFTLSGRIKFTVTNIGSDEQTQFTVTIMSVEPSEPSFTELVIGAGTLPSGTNTQSFDFIFRDYILQDVPLPNYIAFALRFAGTNGETGLDYTIRVNYDQSLSNLTATEVTDYPASQAKVSKIHEALDKTIEHLTGFSGRLRSNFFGRQDINYAVNGPGARLVMNTGKQVRNFPDAQGMFTSWKELFADSLKPLYNLGIGFETETDPQGEKTTVVRVEKMRYFYQDTFVYQFKEVRNYREEGWDEIIYNEIEVGFRKYLEEELNTLDAVHTIQHYLTPIQRHKNKLSIIISAIMDGYALEYTRRQQFSEKPTTSWKYDDDLFFMQTVEGGGLGDPVGQWLGADASFQLITKHGGQLIIDGDQTDQIGNATKISITRFDAQGQPLVQVVADIILKIVAPLPTRTVIAIEGNQVTSALEFTEEEFVAIFYYTPFPFSLEIETSQPFQSIQGVISPDTFPNLRHTPKSILLRYAETIKSGLYFESETSQIRFTKPKHNVALKTILKATEEVLLGRSVSQEIHEGGNLSKFECGSAEGLFIPEKIFFDCTIHWEDYQTIMANPYGLFRVPVAGGDVVAGNLDKLEYNPANQIEASVVLRKRQ